MKGMKSNFFPLCVVHHCYNTDFIPTASEDLPTEIIEDAKYWFREYLLRVSLGYLRLLT